MEKSVDRKLLVKLEKEFYNSDHLPQTDLNEFQAVVVLSAEETDLSGENKQRVLAGLKLCRAIKNSASFVFIGTESHNKNLEIYLAEKNSRIVAHYPALRRSGTTRTQIKSLSSFLKKKKINSLLIVSHAYHIPRIARYCKTYLNEEISYDFYPVGKIEKQLKQMKLEVQKIVLYSQKGHLPLWRNLRCIPSCFEQFFVGL